MAEGSAYYINQIHPIDATIQKQKLSTRSICNTKYQISKYLVDGFTAIFEVRDGTLHIGVGKHIRLAGASGAGKSTCLRRIYKHLIDGNQIENQRIHYLSAQVEWIEGTVFDNIALQHPDIGTDEVQRVLDQWRYGFGNRALAPEQSMADLSAGERQWVAIVRSLLRRPEVLFLDEATNSFDVQTEPQVWKYLLAHIPPQTTLFIVTHRAESPIVVDHEEMIVVTHANLPL